MEDRARLTTIIHQVAASYGFKELKEEHKAVLINFLAGKDVFACLPTGFGKSICFTLLPSLFDSVLKRECGRSLLVLVIAPLTSVIKDQVDSCAELGISALAITRDGHNAADEWLRKPQSHKYQIEYMSPEMAIGTKKWRAMIQSEVVAERLCAVIIDEAHCVKKWGGSFRCSFDELGDLRALIPSRINMMALTATATKTLRQQICVILGMTDYVVVERSPEKPNIYLECQEFTSILENFTPLADELKTQRCSMDRVIIFCKKRVLCSQIYSFFRFYLSDGFTEPPGTRETCTECRLVDMFLAGTHDDVKEKIIKGFKSPDAPLRIVIATIAFGMGIDCNNVRKVIHVGPPEDVESYVQHVGRCGRDGMPASALMLFGKRIMENTSANLLNYCRNSVVCRRYLLFSDFESYSQQPSSTVLGCMCCDICKLTCKCSKCS